jgi:hypothetical protein
MPGDIPLRHDSTIQEIIASGWSGESVTAPNPQSSGVSHPALGKGSGILKGKGIDFLDTSV